MPNWSTEIRRRLTGVNLAPAREAEIVDELSRHLQDRYEELRAGGATDREATQGALLELDDQDLLSRELADVERRMSPDCVVLGSRSEERRVGKECRSRW